MAAERIWTVADLTVSAVSVPDLRSHLRVDTTEEDALIAAYGIAATAAVEKFTQRLVIRRSCTLLLSDLPCGSTPVALSGGAVGTITSVTVDGVALIGCAAVGDAPARLLPATTWPTVVGENYPVSIIYTAGFATIPGDLAVAIRLIVGELFEERRNSSEASLSDIPFSAKVLMQPHRIMPR